METETLFAKRSWRGIVKSVQPRIYLLRSFDERAHTYKGYQLRVDGEIGNEQREFLIAIGKAAQAKHEIRVGDLASGQSKPVLYNRDELSEFYKTSQLKVLDRSETTIEGGPPWIDVAPPLEVYRDRGHRRLSKRTYSSKCLHCKWGCAMPVEMIIDNWHRNSPKRYRTETFCYGPKSCDNYQAGPKRLVPGRNGVSYCEENWVDEDATAHRGPDD